MALQTKMIVLICLFGLAGVRAELGFGQTDSQDFNPSLDKCDHQTIAGLNQMWVQNFDNVDLRNKLNDDLAKRVDVCQEEFGKKLQQDLSNLPETSKTALDKIDKLRQIIIEMELESDKNSDSTARKLLLQGIPKGTFKHSLAIHLAQSGFELDNTKDDADNSQDYINKEFEGAISTVETYLSDLKQLYLELEKASAQELFKYNDSSIKMMINFEIVDALQKGGLDDFIRWIPSAEYSL